MPKGSTISINPALQDFAHTNTEFHPQMPDTGHSILAQIQTRLDTKTYVCFMNCVITITWFAKGKQRKTTVKPHAKIRSLVESNPAIWDLYNEYAKVQSAAEPRKTYRLPIFGDLVAQEDGYLEMAADNQEPEEEVEDAGDELDNAQNSESEASIEEENSAMEDVQESTAMPAEDADRSMDLDVSPREKAQAAANESRDASEESSALTSKQERTDNMGSTSKSTTESANGSMADTDSPSYSRSLQAAGLKSTPNGPPLGFFSSAQPTSSTPTRKKVQFHDENTRPASQSSIPVQLARTIERAPTSPLQQTPTRKRRRSFSTVLADRSSPVERSPAAKRLRSLSTIPAEPSSPIVDAAADGAAASPQDIREGSSEFITNSTPPTQDHEYMIPIMNPEVFPIRRIRLIQEQRFPSATIVRMWSHRDIDGKIIKVTADMQDGPVNHITIDDARLIAALGLNHGAHYVIELHEQVLRIDETFNLEIPPTPNADNLNTFLAGRLLPARHAFLYWLDLHGSADPKSAPFAGEARKIALQLERRTMDVWKEIERYWELERGADRDRFRCNRMWYLGEDPKYTKEQERVKVDWKTATIMWV